MKIADLLGSIILGVERQSEDSLLLTLGPRQGLRFTVVIQSFTGDREGSGSRSHLEVYERKEVVCHRLESMGW